MILISMEEVIAKIQERIREEVIWERIGMWIKEFPE